MLMSLQRSTAAARIGSKLVQMTLLKKISLMVAIDIASLSVCFFLASLLVEGDLARARRYGLPPVALAVSMAVGTFCISGLYGAITRFIDQKILSAATIGLAVAAVSSLALVELLSYRALPRSALMLYWLIALGYMLASRLAARALIRHLSPYCRREQGCRVAIYGAGEAGAKLGAAMRMSLQYRAVCFFDDDDSLARRTVGGLKIYHSRDIAAVCAERGVNMIVIAVPSATPEQRREMMYRARISGVSVKTMYGLMELGDESITTRSIREIKIEDLLGRESIQPDFELFSKCVRAQNVLVTGGGGSIGSELCRQIMTLNPKALHVLDHAEHALYNIEQELRSRFPDIDFHAHLGTVCDEDFVSRVVGTNGIDTIYHAAAYKHVPLVESNMAQGVRNNILGAQNVANVAARFCVKTCVLVSTDKAVRPTSMMGASKRVAELIFQAAAAQEKSGTKFCIVRFGNVLGSSGSVVPLFRKQIEEGGPITITHPEVVRYFMSISEAAQLVMQAGAMARGGDVFVMDMGKPVKIVDLARTMIAMCGYTEKSARNPDGDIEIAYVGLRPAEKLYEEMFAGNDAIPSRHPRIMTTTEYMIEPGLLAQQLAYLMVACATNDCGMIQHMVQKIVKEYVPYRPPEAVPQAERVFPLHAGALAQRPVASTSG